MQKKIKQTKKTFNLHIHVTIIIIVVVVWNNVFKLGLVNHTFFQWVKCCVDNALTPLVELDVHESRKTQLFFTFISNDIQMYHLLVASFNMTQNILSELYYIIRFSKVLQFSFCFENYNHIKLYLFNIFFVEFVLREVDYVSCFMYIENRNNSQFKNLMWQ